MNREEKMRQTFRFMAVPLALALVATLVVAPSATAQTVRGGIQGTVKDDTGAPLPGVTVTLRSPAMQGEQLEVTDGNGGFRFSAVPAGNYSAVFNLEGFQQI